MPVTPAFIADPTGFTSLFAVLVDEALVAGTSNGALAGLAGGPHALATATFLMSFDFELYGSNCARLVVKPAGTAGATPCYFLPYKPDCGISLALAGGANYFFTSTLTGCSVQALGPRATPTVTHSNGRATYNANLAAQTAAADVVASTAAQGVIDTMFPPAAGAPHVGYVRKADYLARLTPGNVQLAKNRFHTAKRHHRVTNFAPAMYNNFKPEIGAFVFGVRTGNDWTFYYQSTVAVTGTRHTGFLFFAVKHKPLISEEIVLGPAAQFYP
ncbi:MAG: hypothetical protein KF764_21060 [Labilithrix sp.]|nr:hypothetical protein [Labilithrix sp.]